MELRRYWQIILKRRGTLLKIIGFVVSIVILSSFLISPVYQFKCNVWIRTEDPKTTLTGVPTDLASLGISTDLLMYSQLAIIRNLPMIRDIIKKMDLENKKGNLVSASEFLEPNSFNLIFKKKGVRIIQIASSQILQVSGFSNSPKEAVAIANEVADSFVAMYNKIIQQNSHQALKFIQESIPKVSAELKQAENDLAAFKVENHVNNIAYLREKLLTSLVSFQETKDTNEANIIDFDRRIGQVHEKLKKIPEFQRSAAEYRTNATLEYIRQKLMDAESNIASNEIKTTPEYYGQKQIQASINKLKDEYRRQASKLLYSETTSRNTIYTTLVQILVENELNRAGALSRRQVLDKLLHDRHKNLDELTMKELQMEPLQRKASALQTAMSNLLAKEAIAKLSSLIDLSNATVIERAALPPEPDQIKNFRWFPKRKLLLLLSFLLSLLVGLSIIFLQEYLDDSFSDAQEIQAFVNVPVLGSLPELPPLEPFTMEAVMAHPPWSQAVLTLSYLLKPLRTEESPGLVAITSAVASEGKSLLTASLGQILASRGLKVMMVDLNFSHPSLASLWKAVSGPSLYEVLQGRSDLSQTGYRVGSNELYLLPGSRTEESLGTLVDLPALKNLMGLLKNSYDAVLLDLPAIGVGEGAPLTALGDQVLMVVAANRTSRELVSCAVEQIKNFQERLEGLILNGVKNIEPWSKWAQPFFYQLKSISQYLQGKLKR